MLEDAIGVAPVGCAVLAYNYFNCDMHRGRPRPRPCRGHRRQARPSPIRWSSPTRATATWPSIGTAEIVHAATRGENITVIFVNNAIYGMTGGQMAPTTLIGADDPDHLPYGPHRRARRLSPSACARCSPPLTVSLYAERVSVHRRRQRQQGQKGHPEGLPEPAERQGLLASSKSSPPAPPTGA